jgi:hypothetical protein
VWGLEYRTEFRDEVGYLRVTASGSYSLSRCKRLVERIVEESAKRAASRVLLDMTGVPGSTPDVHRIALGELSAQVLQGLQIAIMDPIEARDKGIESVANNAGANLRYYVSEREAIEWLLSLQRLRAAL